VLYIRKTDRGGLSVYRETIMKAILKRFEEEDPSLWEENELTLFSQNVSQ